MITLLMVPETSKPTAGLVADVELNRGPKPTRRQRRHISQSDNTGNGQIFTLSETSFWTIVVHI